MKIGILTCIKSNDVCARVGCLRAFNNRTDFFKDYGADTELSAMMTCNGCQGENPCIPEKDPGVIEKVERLAAEEIQVVHCGVCRMQGNEECSRFTSICQMMEEKGIRIVRGTHRE